MTTISVVIITILAILVIVEWIREIGNNKSVGYEINVQGMEIFEDKTERIYPRMSLGKDIRESKELLQEYMKYH